MQRLKCTVPVINSEEEPVENSGILRNVESSLSKSLSRFSDTRKKGSYWIIKNVGIRAAVALMNATMTADPRPMRTIPSTTGMNTTIIAFPTPFRGFP